MKVVRCRGCGQPVEVAARSRPAEWFCSLACVPVCEVPGCATAARGLGGRCWTHRRR